MRLLLVIAAVLCFHVGQTQNTETDSLKRVLHLTTDDHKRVSIFEGLSYAYLSSSPDTALQYALEGLQIAEKLDYLKGEAICTNALGNVYFHVGDYARALQMYLKYLTIKEKLNEGKAIAYFNIAGVYTEQQDYRHALFYVLKAKQEDEAAKDSAGILFDHYTLGSVYLRMEKPDSALFHYAQSYQLAVKLDDKNMLGAILNSYGEAYNFLKDTARAAYYYSHSIPYVLAINDKETLTSNYFGLAKVYKNRRIFDSAVHYARNAFLIAREAPFYKLVLETSTFLANLFSERKQYDSAFFYQELRIATKDSLFNVEQVKKVQNLKFDEALRQQSIETAQIQYRNKVNLLVVIFASVILLAIAVILWRNNKQKQKANALLQQQKQQVELMLSELKSTQAQLIQSEKMASLGELTAGVAHEIQNPLNFINNFSELNIEMLEELKTERKHLNAERDVLTENVIRNVIENEHKIALHGKRADAIVKSMLQHSRVSTGKKEPTDINNLADEYLRLSYHGFRAKEKDFNATLQTDFDASVGQIDVVPQDIGRVLLNLFNNAFYAASLPSKGGFKDSFIKHVPTVWLTTTKLPPSGGRGAAISISVKDNGPGIPQKIVDKIFQPFFTTKPPGQGTGLGLSLSYDIIKAHGGELKVETKEGEGTTFIIVLPINTKDNFVEPGNG